jgi:hypothetical protein
MLWQNRVRRAIIESGRGRPGSPADSCIDFAGYYRIATIRIIAATRGARRHAPAIEVKYE